MSSFFNVVHREIRRATSSWYYLFLLLVLPLFSFVLLWAIFQSGVPRDLPMVVVDGDHSAMSRQLTRMIDAAPSLRIVQEVPDVETARRLVLRNEAYGVVIIPANLERDVRRGESPKTVAYYNAEYLLTASLIRRDLRGASATLSAGLEMRLREAKGEPPKAALSHVEPIRLDYHTLFNPQLNYVYYLLTALLPTMLQIFIIVGTIHVLGVELKEGTAGEWMAAANGSSGRAILGKLLPYTIHFTLVSFIMLAFLFRVAGVPLHGHLQVVLAGTVLFVMAYQAMGLVLIAWIANLRFATSCAAFYATPAFAFIGITFPTMGMPVLGRVWSAILPLTHYLKLVVDQAIKGAQPATSVPTLGILLGFVLFGLVTSIWRMGQVAGDSRYWGRL